MSRLEVRTDQPLALRLINLSELPQQWQWVREAFVRDVADWRHVSSEGMPRRWPFLGIREARWRAVCAARSVFRAHAGPKVLVSHGPRPAAYWGSLTSAGEVDAHLVYSFNFTQLPAGLELAVMRRAFRGVTRFVVASRWERDLYAKHFGIPESRIHFQPWGVQPPSPEEEGTTPIVAGSYVCALGSQARDYRSLFDAFRQTPEIRLVVVATKESVQGLTPLANVTVLTHIPLADAMNILRHSRLMVLALNDAQARCGHVTAVAALHRGKPIIATSCRGLDDYLFPERNAVLVPPHDADAMATAVRRLFQDEAACLCLGSEGRRFAMQYCTETAVVDAFRQWLAELGFVDAATKNWTKP